MDATQSPARKWNVGDEIIVSHANYSRRAPVITRETITRVARKYFYIAKNAYGDEIAFEIETGRERGGENYYASAYTPTDWDAKQFRDGVLEKLGEHKVHSNYDGTLKFSKWSTGQLCELLTLLDRVKADIDATGTVS